MVPDTRPQRGGVASENCALKFPSPPRASYWTAGRIHTRKTQHSTHIIPPDPPLHSQDIVGSPLPTGARGRRQAALAEEWLAYNEDLGEVAAVCVRAGGRVGSRPAEDSRTSRPMGHFASGVRTPHGMGGGRGAGAFLAPWCATTPPAIHFPSRCRIPPSFRQDLDKLVTIEVLSKENEQLQQEVRPGPGGRSEDVSDGRAPLAIAFQQL